MPAAGAAIDAAIWAGLPPAASACMTADAVGAILPTTGFAADAICIAPDVSAPASGDDPADSATPTLPGISFMGPLAFLFLVTATHAARLYCMSIRNNHFETDVRRDMLLRFFRDLRNSIRQYNGIGANRYFPLDICLFYGGDYLSLQTSGAIITARLTPVHTFN
ncbi:MULTISPECIES: hypothetical protein [unclassified Burkholderia]|uniref:hypothetical protein n=1 Tax=unclassified Burkholderia TaxID=2613784 RepID=UPI0012E3DD62|nr:MULTISPECIES: hypothetical protein [unclassified Burkholderia]